jgi:hypothetical protein
LKDLQAAFGIDPQRDAVIAVEFFEDPRGVLQPVVVEACAEPESWCTLQPPE